MQVATGNGGWFIYALGSGWGHLNRALALARVAIRDRPVQVLTNSPYVEQISLEQKSSVAMSNLTLHGLPPTDSLDAARQAIRSLLESVAYDCLLVDTFPRGLVGELAELIPQQKEICHVLIHRDLDPHYVAAKGLESFVEKHYDGVLIPGEADMPLAPLPQVKITAPWLSRNPEELSDPVSLREQLAIPANRPLVLVCATGKPEELSFFGQITEQLAEVFPAITVRCLSAVCPPGCSPDRWLSYWPGMDVLQLADVVVGSGGYNLVHECVALGIPLVGFAMPRRYDRQARRLQKYGYLVGNGEDAIATIIDRLFSARCSVKSLRNYTNGVDTAIEYLEVWQRASMT